MDSEKKEGAKVEDAKTKAPPAEQPKKSERSWKKTRAWRTAKWSLLIFGGLFAIAMLVLLSLPLWIGLVGTSLANMLVPKYTGTAFNVERINLNPYTGKLLVSGVRLANPAGYSEEDAFALGSLSADVEFSTLLSDTIHVREIVIDAPFASYVFDAEGSNNFARIMAAVNEKLGPKKEKEEPGGTKVEIDKVTVRGVRAAVGNGGVLEIDSLTLTDFGKATPAQVEISGVRLVNPQGFPEPNAVTVNSISIGVETADLSTKPIVFHDILIDSPNVFSVDNKADEDNFDVIFKPFKGAGKTDEEKEAEEKGDDAPAVVIDKLDISGLKVKYGLLLPVPIPLPAFSNIGKEGGSTIKEVYGKIVGVMSSATDSLGDGVKKVKDGASKMWEKIQFWK